MFEGHSLCAQQVCGLCVASHCRGAWSRHAFPILTTPLRAQYETHISPLHLPLTARCACLHLTFATTFVITFREKNVMRTKLYFLKGRRPVDRTALSSMHPHVVVLVLVYSSPTAVFAVVTWCDWREKITFRRRDKRTFKCTVVATPKHVMKPCGKVWTSTLTAASRCGR